MTSNEPALVAFLRDKGYRLVQFAPPPQRRPGEGSVEPSDALRSFVFMSNLAAQEATGESAASVSPERVLTRLKGSEESAAYLFGLVDAFSEGHSAAGIGPAVVGEFGVPLVASGVRTSGGESSLGGRDDFVDCAAFIHLSLPLLEELDTAEFDIVFDTEYLPVPGADFTPAGREIAEISLSVAERLAGVSGRQIFHVGTQVAAGDASPGFCPDPLGELLTARGYAAKHSDIQVEADVPENPPVPLLPQGTHVAAWPDYDIPARYLPQVLRLLTVASIDADVGALTVDPIQWTPERLADAARRLRDRHAHTLLVALVTDEDGIVSMSELSRHEAADPTVAEWTLTVTARGHRRRGHARAVKVAAMEKLSTAWPQVSHTFASHSAQDPAMLALDARIGARRLGESRMWEKRRDQILLA